MMFSKQMWMVVALVLPSSCLPGLAEEVRRIYSTDGDAYDATLAGNAIELLSVQPKFWYRGEPSESHEVESGLVTITLHPDCSALHSEFGAGTWGWWNDSFHAEFSKGSVRFSNQTVFEETLTAGCEDGL
jgi:hypothetical protein